MSRRSTLLALLALLALLPLAAAAAPPAPQTRVAVLDLKDGGTLDHAAADGLSALLASEVARRPALAVVAGADLRAILSFERQRQLAGCVSTGCAADLGVAYLVTSEVSKVGASWLLSLALLDAPRAASVSRLTRRVDAVDGLLAELPGAVDELLAPLGAKAARTASTRFDGAWTVAIECPKVTDGERVKGYAFRFPGTVKDGRLQAQRLTEGTPGFLRLEGAIDADGQAQLSASGLTSGPEYAMKGAPPGTLYTYGVAARFEAGRGTGRRAEGRPCTFTFVKE
jgi:hypothetical protein